MFELCWDPHVFDEDPKEDPMDLKDDEMPGAAAFCWGVHAVFQLSAIVVRFTALA